MAAKKTATKKVAAKKATVRKTPAKRAATRTTAGPSGPQTGQPAEGMAALKPVEEVAAESQRGKWGSGRDRDDALRQAGHDPAVVSKEAAKLRAAAKPEPTRLPIPNNRRGSSWT